MAILDFGGIQQRIGSAAVAIDRSYELDDAGVPWLETQRWSIEIRLIKEPSSIDINAQITALENTFSETRGNITIYQNNGTPTAHNIQPGQSLGGVRVTKPPSYSKYSKGELVTMRHCQLEVTAVLKKFTEPKEIISWREQTSNSAGGPTYEVLERNIGFGERQRTRTDRPGTATQSGTITFAADYGDIPPSIINQARTGPVKYTYNPPRKIGHGQYASFVGHSITYSYEYKWPGDIDLMPTRWT